MGYMFDYFGRKMCAGAAADAVITGIAFSLEDFIGVAELEPEWELEVVVNYIDKIGKIAEMFPDDGKDKVCPYYENNKEDFG